MDSVFDMGAVFFLDADSESELSSEESEPDEGSLMLAAFLRVSLSEESLLDSLELSE